MMVVHHNFQVFNGSIPGSPDAKEPPTEVCEMTPVPEPPPGVSSIRFMGQWIGLRENLQESPIFNGKIYGFL
jgi:hypothetical protein